MKLSKILKGVEVLNDISAYLDLDIEQLSNKCENPTSQSLFFCYKGEKDGHEFIEQAKNKGAVAFVVEHKTNNNVPQIIVKSSRKAMAQISQNFYDTKDAKVIGITGTNGKTTTSFLVKEILEKAGHKVGVIGTQGVYFADKFIPATLTTPDPILLHELFAIMKNAGVDYIVMEVSAHAIALEKVYGINFVSKIITNITEDHLDFFENMENYSKTKIDFMKQGKNRIINIDDPYLQIFAGDDSVKKYGLNNPSDTFALEINKTCSNYIININDEVCTIDSKLYGLFNVYNSMAAAECAKCLGVSFSCIVEGLESFKGVTGRFNVYNLPNDNKIIVDFAHTPDGLENVLKTARNITDGKLYVVFGCGGNRDRKKRPIMGEIAESLADYCIITVDNPRYEKPVDILRDIISGMHKNCFSYEEDRPTAIQKATNLLKEHDTVIICGKGGENYIDINGVKNPYSDFEQVEKNIERLL